MANKKISDLTAAGSLNLADLFEIEQSSVSKKATLTLLKNLIAANLTSVSGDFAVGGSTFTVGGSAIDKTFVGLGNVENTALSTWAGSTNITTLGTIAAGSIPASLVTGLSKSSVGLGNVDNTSDATKNSASATLTNKTISGSSNTLSNIGNASLTNSSITIAGTSVSLGGSITATSILDSIGSTRGSILYKGASGWAILTPGTSGYVLTSAGAGADPSWAATLSSVSWGDISGTLSSQTDLQDALDDKQDVINFGTGVLAALGANVGSMGAPVLYNGDLGQPISGNLTDCTGLPLATGVTGNLLLSNFAQASTASVLLGRGSASGGGNYQEISLGSGLSMSGTTLSATGGGSGGTKTYAFFTALNNQAPASSFATLDTRNAIPTLDFDDAADEAAIFMGIMPEAASLGSGLIVKMHISATSATSGNAVMEVCFERMNTDMDSDSWDTAATVTQAVSGTSGTPVVASITTTNIDGITAGDLYRVKVRRLGTNGSDTVSGDIELIATEIRSAS